jgi:hypothetical protein
MDLFVQILLKLGAVLVAAGLLWLAAKALRKYLPPEHRLQRHLEEFSREGSMLQAGKFLLVIVFLVFGAVVTIVYS